VVRMVGFNPGSTLSALDAQGIGRVSFNTTLAACSAGLTALFYSYFKGGGKWDLALTVNGFLAGLVAITCPLLLGRPRGRVPARNRHGHRGGLGYRLA